MQRYYTPSAPKVFMYAIGVMLLFLLMAYLSRNLYRTHNPGSFNSARAVERKKAREDLQKASGEALKSAGWANEAKGIVRLPIDRAMEITVQQYQNPAGARSNLVERVRKANVPPPAAPAAPQQPSEFE
ncbi:MAG: hypothetical protein ACO1QB_08110 [Verrucomicrobiales bacterium]